MKTYVITGATRGFGLALARELAKVPEIRVILAVRDWNKGKTIAAELGAHASAVKLDVSSMQDVKRFVADWKEPLAGLVNNAGLQQTDGMRTTAEGLEETLATNHLGAYALSVGLLPHLSSGGRVLFIGSATHDPNSGSTRFGFRGARFTSIAALARGDTDTDDPKLAGQDRYATSKFLNTVTALELSRRIPAERTAFFTLDPGMMPGTGLARTAPLALRILWQTVLPLVSPFLENGSSTKRSARTGVWLLTEPSLQTRSGECFSFDREPSRHVWAAVHDPALGKRAIDQTAELTGLAV